MKTLTAKDVPAYGDYHSSRGERIELPKGFYAVIRLENDSDADRPWENDCGRGPVREALKEDKTPGERVLGPTGSRDVWFLYDFAAAVQIAKRDGWDAPPYKTGTKGQQAVRAVEADYQFCKGWCDNEWEYVGVRVALFDKSDNEIGSDDLWGVESCGDYWRETAAEMVSSLYQSHTAALAKERRAAIREAREVRYWAQRDVLTVQPIRS